jgi:hypothetical protein
MGLGLGKYYYYDNDYSDENNKDDNDIGWGNNRLYSSYGSIRVCYLNPNFHFTKNAKDKSVRKILDSEQTIEGLGIEISVRRIHQQTRLSTPGKSVYWVPPEYDLLWEFRDNSIIFTPGLQVINPEWKIGTFVGPIGIGYTRNRHTWGHYYETAFRKDPSLSIENEVAPVVFDILPISIEWFCYKNIAIGLSFSGLLLYPGRTRWTFKGETSDDVIWDDYFWLDNFQIGLTIGLRLH